MYIHSRKEWGAQPPKSRAMMKEKLDRVFIHWPGTDYPDQMSDEQILQSIQRFHMVTQGWSDIGYSFAVGRDAGAFYLRGLNVSGGHTFGENDDCYAIVMIVDPDTKPTADQLRTATHLIEHIRMLHDKKGPLDPKDIVVMGHRRDDQAKTSCPGPDLDAWAWGYNHARDYVPETAPKPAPQLEHIMFLKDLYRLLLGAVDEAGLAYWAQEMANGLPRSVVVRSFADAMLRAGR